MSPLECKEGDNMVGLEGEDGGCHCIAVGKEGQAWGRTDADCGRAASLVGGIAATVNAASEIVLL